MRFLIVYCHPHSNSHNGRTLERVKKVLNAGHQDFEVLDLYKKQFDPCVSEGEYVRGLERKVLLDDDVRQMQVKLTLSDVWIFIYPVWWYGMPACLKGFFDRVFTNGFAFRYKKSNKVLEFIGMLLSFFPGIRGLLRTKAVDGKFGGKKVIVFRTYGGPRFANRIFGNTVCDLEHAILGFCGVRDIIVHELFQTDRSSFTSEDEQRYLDGVEKRIVGIRIPRVEEDK